MSATTAFPEIDFNPLVLKQAQEIFKKAQRDQRQSFRLTNLAIDFKEQILEIDLYSGTTVEERVESTMARADEALANLVLQGLQIEAMLNNECSLSITDQTKQTLNTYLKKMAGLYKKGRKTIVSARRILNELPFPTPIVDPPTPIVDVPTPIVDVPIRCFVKSNRHLVAKHQRPLMIPPLMTPRSSVFLKKQ